MQDPRPQMVKPREVLMGEPGGLGSPSSKKLLVGGGLGRAFKIGQIDVNV